MPTYELACDDCSLMTEATCRVSERNDQPCPECGVSMRRYICATSAVIGAMPSKPLDYSRQLGKVFETNAEFRQYEKENPGVSVLSKTDDRVRNMQDRARNAMDRTAANQGYRDHEDKVKRVKRGELAPTLG